MKNKFIRTLALIIPVAFLLFSIAIRLTLVTVTGFIYVVFNRPCYWCLVDEWSVNTAEIKSWYDYWRKGI